MDQDLTRGDSDETAAVRQAGGDSGVRRGVDRAGDSAQHEAPPDAPGADDDDEPPLHS
jgi:hypothetical protein